MRPQRSTSQASQLGTLAVVLCLALAPRAVGAAGAAGGSEIEGVAFDSSVRIGDRRVPLRGLGLLRYRILFDAYVAAFYAEPAESAPGQREDPLAGDARRLEIEYFWALGAAQFADATLQGIRANVSASELEALRPSIAKFNTFYEDIEPGDRYALTYGEGTTELSKNGRALGSMDGAAFARAIFAIWLGEAPLSPGLKQDLLGGVQ